MAADLLLQMHVRWHWIAIKRHCGQPLPQLFAQGGRQRIGIFHRIQLDQSAGVRHRVDRLCAHVSTNDTFNQRLTHWTSCGKEICVASSLSRRCSISAQYSEFNSKPTNCRPQRRAATAVVPLPMNGSSTTPPGGQDALIMRSTISSGFWVGGSARSLCSGCSRDTLQTSFGL